MKVKPNFELHHNLYIIVDSNEKKKENNKKTCTFYKWEGGGHTEEMEKTLGIGAVATAVSFYRENRNCCTYKTVQP